MNNRIRIKFGPIEFEAEGDSELIQREREKFFSLLPQAISAVSPVVSEQAQMVEVSSKLVELNDTPKTSTLPDNIQPIHYESIASFVKEKSFANDVDLVMGVSYYLDCVEKQGTFTAKEIENKFAEARRAKPSNTSHCINLNIRKGFIGESSEKKDSKKAYTVLSEGIIWCESYIPPEATTKKKAAKVKQQGSTTESSLLAFTLDELNLDNYCEISSLEKIDDQILVVILIYTNEKNIDYFSFEDIVAILKNKFKIPVTSRQVQYFFDKSGTKFDKKIEKRRSYHRIMSNGVKEAEKIIAQQKE